jgi:hypothetical protein
MTRQIARLSVDQLNRNLSQLGFSTNEVLNPDGSAGVEYVHRPSRRPVAALDRTRGGRLKWAAATALSAAVVSAVSTHAAAFATLTS